MSWKKRSNEKEIMDDIQLEGVELFHTLDEIDQINKWLGGFGSLIEKLEEIPGVKVGYPKGAFYCIVQLPIKNSDAFAQWLLEEFDVDGETIMVAPAAGFYSSPGVGLNQIRIAYVLNKESLIKAVHILKQALVVYKE